MLLNKMLSLINEAVTLCTQFDFNNEYGDNFIEFAKCFDNTVQAANNLSPKIQNGIEGVICGLLSTK